MEDYEVFCQETYLKIFDRTYNEMVSTYLSGGRNRTLSDTKQNEFEVAAQKEAMKQTIVEALIDYDNISSSNLWRAVRKAHMYRKSGVSDLDVIEEVVSADQSWKKSSGHAFEEVIKDYATVALAGTDIEVVLQRDLTTMLANQELSNQQRDYDWLAIQVQAQIFDLYCIYNKDNKKYCFGCIQSKTSIRDRVTRDREPSVHAMNKFFWSIIIVLDDQFMHMPKFINMVNGGSEEFPENGWHGMYLFTDEEWNDRIYPIKIDFIKFREHAVKAASDWMSQRQWFDKNWRAE